MIAKLGFRVKYHNWWLCRSVLHTNILKYPFPFKFIFTVVIITELHTCKSYNEIYASYLNYLNNAFICLKSYLYIPAQIIYTILHRIIALFVHSFKQNNVQKQHQSFLYTKKTDLILWASTCPCIDSHITSKTFLPCHTQLKHTNKIL